STAERAKYSLPMGSTVKTPTSAVPAYIETGRLPSRVKPPETPYLNNCPDALPKTTKCLLLLYSTNIQVLTKPPSEPMRDQCWVAASKNHCSPVPRDHTSPPLSGKYSMASQQESPVAGLSGHAVQTPESML